MPVEKINRPVKVTNGQEFVVGGWLPGKGRLSDQLGSLLVGYYDDERTLRYAGRVGSGINDAVRGQLSAALADRRRDASPFERTPKLADPVWVDPVLVVQVEFAEWTSVGVLRAPRFKGIRVDKDAEEVRREG